MSSPTTIYRRNTATGTQVYAHLMKCDDDFIETLGKKVNIPAYSTKIIQNSVTFEAWENDDLVGLIAAYFNDEENRSGFITNVSTVKGHAGKGIASGLMKRCIEYGKEKNFRQIQLEVAVENNKAIQLYKKFNFTGSDIKQGQVMMKINLDT